ncbi:fusaric acid resistance protein [Pseudomonas taiwanensis]|uniref:FUSC family protein n=1 Tax=Pseudomonas taiwanensis TaxID=470150 RepID=UPI0015BE1295|nr:FUSC family protein [Pseudomonas taiwanensis]NWL81108.1 fusaric acid resistance protein [Pseudomonas taiwanensis]
MIVLNLPPARDWFYSIKVFAASMLALYIALYMQLPRPYWAMATVYIVANPFVGPTSSKALYRALGTLLGASAAVFIVPLLSQQPLLLSLVVAFWTGGMLFLSMHVRTADNYALMLAGYTMPMIALPVVDNPQAVFDLAYSRFLEILLGIICASVVGSLFWPSRLAPVLAGNAKRWFGDARDYCALQLQRPRDLQRLVQLRANMVTTFNGLELMIGQLPHEGAHPRVVRNARELRERMALLLPAVDTLHDSLIALREKAPHLAARLAPSLHACLDWLQGEADDETRTRLRLELDTLQPDISTLGDAGQSLLSSTLYRLRQWLDLWQDCRDLHQRLDKDDNSPWTSVYRHWHLGSGARFFDRGLMLYSVAYIILGIFVATQLWIWLQWTDGASAVVLAAVACCFFATLDEPAVQIRRFFVWTSFSVVLASLYLFLVLPNVHDFPLLVLAFAGPFICVGTLTVQPRFYLPTLLIAVNTATFISIQGAYEANVQVFLNSNLAGPIGLLFAFLWTLVFRPFGAELLARRMTRSSWQDLADMSRADTLVAQRRLAGRLLDRFAQHLPRLNLSGQDSSGAERELRIAYNLLDIKAHQGRLPEDLQRPLQLVVRGVGRHFRRNLRSAVARDVAPSLLNLIEHARQAVAAAAPQHGEDALAVLHALAGLEIALRPALAAPPVQGTEQPIPAGLDGAAL